MEDVPKNADAGNARLRPRAGEVGARTEPRAPRGWHSRGYMPHFDSNDVVQHVTFHLADSLPKEALERLAAETDELDPERREVEKRRRLEALIDAGHGACWLRRPDCARIVQDSLFHFDGERYRMIAWVVMPNHVHTLFQTIGGWSMASVVASWKSWTGKHIADMLLREGHHWEREAPSSRLRLTREDGASRSQERRPLQVWHPEYWDRYIRDERHFANALAYIHNNPVKAGLVARPEDWPWSSAALGNADPGNAGLLTCARTEPRGPSKEAPE